MYDINPYEQSELMGRVSKTLDLDALGVNLTQISDSLLSPAGIVDQFALSILLQAILIIGYLTLGILYNWASGTITSGPLVPFIEYFEIHLSNQATAQTLVRSVLGLVWELVARSMTVFLMFGVGNTVTQVLESVTLDSVKKFLTSEVLGEIMIFRFVSYTAFAITAFALIIPAFTALGLGMEETARSLVDPESMAEYLMENIHRFLEFNNLLV